VPRNGKRSAAYLVSRRTLLDRLLRRNRFEQPPVTGPEVEGLELIRNGQSHTAWWSGRLAGWRPWPMPVGALVPEGFEAYARLLHPVTLRGEADRVSWSHVAEWSGRTLGPTSFFGDIAMREDGTSWQSVGNRPWEGELPEDLYLLMFPILERSTSTPDDCWFALWFGWGDLDVGDDESLLVDVSPDVTSSGRRFVLYRGPLRSMTRLRFFGGSFRPPSFWWPEDRAWFVSTEIDAWSTYIGGPASLIGALMAADGFEVLPTDPADPFDGTHPGQTWVG
jgi:hypothetical protein